MSKLPTVTSELLRGDRWTTTDAQRIFDLWRSSGMSLSAFAGRHGIKPSRLYWWRGRLRQTAGAAITFKEVKAPRPPPAPPPGSVALEVVLHSGLVVRVGSSFDAVALGRLLAVLEGAPG